MKTLAIMPWLRVRRRISAGQYTVLPYSRKVSPYADRSDLQEPLDICLEPYKNHRGRPVHHAALLRLGRKRLITRYSSEETASLFGFADLLAFAGLAARSYFVGIIDYCNRDHFRLVLQPCSGGAGAFTRTTRRRDGFNEDIVSTEVFRVHRPAHVSPGVIGIDVDETLLSSLVTAQETMPSAEWTHLYQAVVNFNAANTDSDHVSLEAETVFVVSAFERLLDTNGKENKLAERFVNRLQPTEDLPASEFPRLSADERQRQFRRSNTVRDIWIRDLFRLRGNVAHGHQEATYPSVWSVHDHLLLATFALPLLLKAHLQAGGFYELTFEDRVHTDTFERLACIEHCVRRDDDGEEGWPWSEILALSSLQRALADAESSRRTC